MLWPYILTNFSSQMCTFCYLIYKQNNTYLTQKKSNWGNFLKQVSNTLEVLVLLPWPLHFVLLLETVTSGTVFFSWLPLPGSASTIQTLHVPASHIYSCSWFLLQKGVNKRTRNHCFPKKRNFINTELLKIRSLHARVSTRQAAVHLPFMRSRNTCLN